MFAGTELFISRCLACFWWCRSFVSLLLLLLRLRPRIDVFCWSFCSFRLKRSSLENFSAAWCGYDGNSLATWSTNIIKTHTLTIRSYQFRARASSFPIRRVRCTAFSASTHTIFCIVGWVCFQNVHMRKIVSSFGSMLLQHLSLSCWLAPLVV